MRDPATAEAFGDPNGGGVFRALKGIAAVSLAAAPAAVVLTPGVAGADVQYPANCKTWATGWAWTNNCWLGYGYEENGNMTVGIQGHLKGKGFYGGTVDGKWGALTDGAVKNFQASRGIAADGIVGSTTWNHFYNTKTYVYSTSGYWVYDANPAAQACRDCFWLDRLAASSYYLHWYVLDIEDNAEYLMPMSVFGPG